MESKLETSSNASSVVEEIRERMAKLDRVDEIVRAVEDMMAHLAVVRANTDLKTPARTRELERSPEHV